MQLQGNFLDYFIAFGSGVLVSFSPCVYPVLPITAGYIAGINTKGTKWMGFLISVIYVFGLAITYCSLAVIAALTDRFFGQIQNNPYIFIGVANIVLLFALIMLDVIVVPNIGFEVRDKIKLKNIWSILLLGMASGLVVGSCTAPILGTLLIYVADKHLIHGISLLFVFSYGVGFSLILVGTFSGLLAHMPKSGIWMVRIKQMCGVILIGVAEYLLIKAGMLIF